MPTSRLPVPNSPDFYKTSTTVLKILKNSLEKKKISRGLFLSTQEDQAVLKNYDRVNNNVALNEK